MGNFNFSLIVIVLIFFTYGCKNNNLLFDKNKMLNNTRSTFGVDYKKSNLLSHFPKKIKNPDIYFRAFPPTCPPTYNCTSQSGDVYLIVKKSDYQKELDSLIKTHITFKTLYTTQNIIINRSKLRNDFFIAQKCNNVYPKKFPIPYFEEYDFGLGVIKEKKKINSELHFNYIYTIPKDLEVYVINAKSGNFWKKDCNEERPISLKEWQHGFSKGFAVSEKENVLIYWVMVW